MSSSPDRQTSAPALLVIDDDRTICRSICRTLEGEPFRVLVAQTERAAVEILCEQRIDVVLCDRHLPGSDGLEILSTLRETNPRIVRLMITSDAQSQTFIRALNEAGVRKFLLKPWTEEQLRGIVRQAFGLAPREEDVRRTKEIAKTMRPTARPSMRPSMPPSIRPTTGLTMQPSGSLAPPRGNLARLAAFLGVGSSPEA